MILIIQKIGVKICIIATYVSLPDCKLLVRNYAFHCNLLEWKTKTKTKTEKSYGIAAWLSASAVIGFFFLYMSPAYVLNSIRSAESTYKKVA
jgi:hypothetical protein